MVAVNLHKVSKNFNQTKVIKDVSIDVNQGEFCVFVGPSGCGKSTLLRLIAGLEEPTNGRITIDGEDVTFADPAARGVGMVFQNYALYPHMTVEENMSFGLRMNNAPKPEIERKVSRAAKMLRLSELRKRKPASLSGGQRQRVAIGRALVKGAKVFLFDEPLSNLDAELRVEMRIEITRLHKELGATIIYVTHDQTEAMTMADKIVVLRDGRVEQKGRPLELYDNPANKFVAGFLGSPSMNFLKARIIENNLVIPALGDLIVKKNFGADKNISEITVGIRPHDINLKKSTKEHKIEFVENLGNISFCHLKLADNSNFIVESGTKLAFASQDMVGISVKEKDIYVFDNKSGERIK